MDKLTNHNWPGNVRELMNTIERGVILSTQNYLGAHDIQIEDKSAESSETGNRNNNSIDLAQVFDSDAGLIVVSISYDF